MTVRSVPILALACLVLVLSSCGSEKPKPKVSIDTLALLEDGAMNFKMKVPGNWIERRKVGDQANYYSSDGVIARFTRFQDGETGAKVAIRVTQIDSTMTLDQVIEETKEYSVPEPYSPVQQHLFAEGDTGKMYEVIYPGYPDGEYKGRRYFGVKDDSVVTIVEVLAFGNTFAELEPKFNEIVNSVSLAYELPTEQRVDTIYEAGDAFIPDAESKRMGGNGYSMMLPANFKSVKERSASAKQGAKYIGDGDNAPKDCYVQVEVFDASKQKDLDKIAAENQKLYKAGSIQNAKLAGLDARKISDERSAIKANKVNGTIYFAIKGDNMYRVSVYYFAPEADKWRPVFDKAVESLSLN